MHEPVHVEGADARRSGCGRDAGTSSLRASALLSLLEMTSEGYAAVDAVACSRAQVGAILCLRFADSCFSVRWCAPTDKEPSCHTR